MPSWLTPVVASSDDYADVAPALEAAAAEMRAAAREGQKPLLEALKAAGVAKMGIRQRLAKGLRERVDEDGYSDLEATTKEAAPTAAAPDFWASMLDVSEAATASEFDFTAPVALDASA